MTKLSDILKSAMAQQHEAHAPQGKGKAEKKVQAKSVTGPKPVKKASGRGR